jgi:GTP cyclohydrolase IA
MTERPEMVIRIREASTNQFARASRGVTGMLDLIGEDPTREGLERTPQRFVEMLWEMTSGYSMDPASVVTTFPSDGCDEMVTVGPIPFYSLCEHHLAPFHGEAWVAYIPNGRIIGLSKLPRLVEVYARRLQVQERLTNQVADALTELIDPVGVGVLVKARHLCMEMRGVRSVGAATRTTALRGALLDKPAARAEFLTAVGR